MRLLKDGGHGDLSSVDYHDDKIPRYAILSHTWGADGEEVTFRDLMEDRGKAKAGYKKIEFCRDRAASDGLHFFWVDTCCIDKSSSAELSEAINSMFRWYEKADKCYVYLSDVSISERSTNLASSPTTWDVAFKKSRWFRRGWTLQELLAPASVDFFSSEGDWLGSKKSLEQHIREITGIAIEALRGGPLIGFEVEERISWVKHRETKRQEDQAYSLLGIFNVHMPLLYGEGKESAFVRLREQIDKSLKFSIKPPKTSPSPSSTVSFCRDIDFVDRGTSYDNNRKQEIRYQHDRHRKCHVAFKMDNYEQQKDINAERAFGTCQWVLRDQKYIEWHQSSANSLLWISADPGCGKSVLSKSLVDHELQNTSTHTVCYFFFKDNKRQNQLSIALCTLLHQLFDNQPHLLRYAIPAYEKNGNKLSQEESELWRILLAANADPMALNVTCVLDALDECQDGDRSRLIDMLSHFHVNSSSRRNNWLKFLVTSRPYDDIQRTFQKSISILSAIRLRGEDENEQIRKEINMVIGLKVSKLASDLLLKPETKTRLEQKLLQMKHRTYLWLYLAIDHVYQTYKNSLRPDDESIESLPSSVEAAYEKILQKVALKLRERVKMILQIVVGARRPLTTGEMALALDIATSPHLQSAADFSINKDHLERNMRDWCGLFIFINDSKIFLIHQTAKEFLLVKGSKDAASLWRYSLDPTGCERIMAMICVDYLLLLNEFNHTSHPMTNCVTQDDRLQLKMDQKHQIEGLLLYSSENWASHVRNAAFKLEDAITSRGRELVRVKSDQFQLWFPHSWRAFRPYLKEPIMNDVSLAAFNGHEVILRMILDAETVDLEERDQEGRTALVWAAELGHEKVIQTLLENGADVNTQGGPYGNALQAASWGGHETVARMLLCEGAKVNARGGYYGNALYAASEGGYEKVVRMLLKKGADINAQGGRYGNTLQMSSWEGYEEELKMLLDVGVQMNAEDGQCDNALYAASWRGHEKVVQMLLDEGTVNADLGEFGNALQAASEGGHETVVKILLNRGAEVNAQGGEYGNALQAASLGGHEKVVEMLLEWKAEVNAQGGPFGNALQAASGGGHETVVEMLLDQGAEVNAQAGYYGNALQAASEGGNETVVNMLLERGAEVNAQGGKYGNALQAAIEEGHKTVVQLLQKWQQSLVTVKMQGSEAKSSD